VLFITQPHCVQLQLYTVCKNCLTLMQHTITKYTEYWNNSQHTEIILPIMLALCLMLSGTYYVQNYASIIGWCLICDVHYYINFHDNFKDALTDGV